MLISCVAYEKGQKIADIAPNRISDYVRRPDCFVWVALRDATAGELEQMREQFGLHPLAVEDANHGHQRPKIEEYGDSLFAVLHMIEPQPGGELKVGEAAIFVGRNYVLAVRRGAEKGFQEVRARSEREPELLRNGSGYVCYALMDAVVDRYFPLIESLEIELDEIEGRVFEGVAARENIRALYVLKQKLVTLKHAVAPLLEAVGKLYGGRVPPVCAGMGEYFRDIADHLVRLNQGIDAVRDMVVTALSVNLSMITLQENETMKRLAAYAALVAVPTMIAGIYGMNFQHMPELDWKFGYPLALGVMTVVDTMIFVRLRRAGWI
ncbi:MAG: magnesium/cobalt transporter CorA [Gammaproteobacteria bacterium]|nr:magnesium/cobalt transporter CorA [Gammaproteobacteria bacterium]